MKRSRRLNIQALCLRCSIVLHNPNEHRLARFCLFEEVSDPGVGDAGLRDSGDVDGGGVSGGDEVDHR